MLYLAIDQHRKQLTVNMRNEKGDILLKRQVSTEWKRVREFFRDVQQQSQAAGGYVAILEVCGFNNWLLKLLKEYGCRETILVQPEKRSKKKTDRRDANVLGEILWVNRERFLAGKRVQGIRRVHEPSERVAENRQITALRVRLGQFHTRIINKIKHILRKHNLEQECPTKGIQTQAAVQWLRELQLGPIDRLEMDQLLAQWKLCEEQMGPVEEEIAVRQERDTATKLLATIPGGSAYSSLALASRMDSIERFPHRGSLPNYWGLTPGCRNSGQATDRLGSITKQGSTIARFILGQWITHVMRKDPAMKTWYLRIKHRRGAKIARVATMRRLSEIMEEMVKRNQPYVIGGLPRVTTNSNELQPSTLKRRTPRSATRKRRPMLTSPREARKTRKGVAS